MELLTTPSIEQRIYMLREHKVMLDKDLAEVYGVSTRVLNQAVKRNKEKFPLDFVFQLEQNRDEALDVTICDIQTLLSEWGYGSGHRLYGTRCANGRQHAPKPPGGPDVAFCGTRLCSAGDLLATDKDLARKLEGDCEKIRWSF